MRVESRCANALVSFTDYNKLTVISRSGSHCLHLKSVPYQMALWRLFPETFEAPHGAPPNIGALPDYGEIATWLAETIRYLSAEEGYPLSKMAVIYAMKTPENESGMNLPLLIGKVLDKRGLLHNWISKDYRAKKSYDVTRKA